MSGWAILAMLVSDALAIWAIIRITQFRSRRKQRTQPRVGPQNIDQHPRPDDTIGYAAWADDPYPEIIARSALNSGVGESIETHGALNSRGGQHDHA